jgi:hypothetical protein
MSAILMIIVDAIVEEPLQMRFVQSDHMVQNIAATTFNPTFSNPILPRALE